MYKRIGEFAAVAAPVRDPMIPARVFTAPPAVVPDRVVRPARWERRYEVSVLCCDLLCLALANLIVAVGYRPTTALADGQRIAVIVVCTVVTVLSMAFQKVGTEEFWDLDRRSTAESSVHISTRWRRRPFSPFRWARIGPERTSSWRYHLR